MKKLLFLIPLLAVLALASPAYAGQSNHHHHKCKHHCYKPSPTPSPTATPTPDTKGDGPTGVVNTEPDRINSPTASNGAGIGGGPG